MIHVDLDHTKSNQPIPSNSTNIVSIHDSYDIREIENVLAYPVNSVIHASPIFTNGSESDPPLPPHDSPEEIVTLKENPKPSKNPPNPEPDVPTGPYSYPGSSDSSSSESS